MLRALLLLFASVLLTASAGEQASEPILRIETGFHTEPIRQLDAAADGTVLSVSDDKTARLWRVADGAFIPEQVLRVPIGPGDEGKFSAGAISPDGRWVAVGIRGWNCIHLLDRRNGALVRRLGPLFEEITLLRFSPDGRALLACQGGDNGIQVFDPTSGQVLWQDRVYVSGCYGACWLPDGGVVSTSFDGHLRRYDAQGRRTQMIATRLGRKPYAIASDGRGNLVVGFYDTCTVARYQDNDLSEHSPLDTTGERRSMGNLGIVAWAAGQWWAGGVYGEQAKNGLVYPWILHWPEPTPRRIPSPDTVTADIIARPGSSHVLFANNGESLRVSLSLLNADGQVIAQRVQQAIASFQAAASVFSVNHDARRIRVGLHFRGADPIFLDLANGVIGPSPLTEDGLQVACTETPDLRGADWRGTTPSLNGTPLTLETNERSSSLAINPKRRIAILGTNRAVLAFNRDGILLWRQITPYTCGVLTSGDGRSVIAAHDDGTLRWYRLGDGVQYLTAFIHAQDRRWVAWTPSGYYWASPGAEDLIGWHINRYTGNSHIRIDAVNDGSPAATAGFQVGDVVTALAGQPVENTDAFIARLQEQPEGAIAVTVQRGWQSLILRPIPTTTEGRRRIGIQISDVGDDAFQPPDFVPASKMAEHFNRPDIVKRCLAEALPDTELPDVLKLPLTVTAAVRGIPRVAIITPQGDITLPEGSASALVEASVEDTGGGVDEIRVQINGKTQIVQRLQPNPSARRTLRFEVPLAPGDNAVRVSAFNTNRTESHAAQVTFRIPERKQTSVLHGLVIGAGKYQNPKYQLTAPVRDAEAIRSTLSEVAKPLYASIRWTFLRDEQVVKSQIAAAFDNIRQQAQPADTFIFYYAGHGVLADPDNSGQPRFVLVTTDILQMHDNSERVLEKGVTDAELRAWCQAIPAQRQVMFIDACQSGGAVATIAMRGDDEERALAQLSRAAGVVVFAASTDQEGAAEITSLGHGLFTYAVLEGLQGKARMQDRPVTVRSLDAWISQTVPELSQKYRNRMQIPTSLHRGQDFPLALPPAR